MPAKPSPSAPKGGLFRQFILPQLVITGLVGFMMLFWAGQTRRSEVHERFSNTAKSIANLTQEMNLPNSARMARDLSNATGLEVVFVIDGKIITPDPLSSSREMAAKLAAKTPGRIVTHADSEALALPLRSARENLLVLQDRQSLLQPATGGFFWPLAGGLVIAIASAFLISRSVVWPLRNLANHLHQNTSDNALRIPEKLKNRNDEIGFLATSLEEERTDLLSEQEERRKSEHMALLGQLATGLAHEIKNPAAAILMQAQTLEEESGKLIHEEAEQIVSLVNQWLFVAKPEPPSKKQHDLVRLLKDLQKKLGPLLAFHRVELVLEAPASLPLRCDARRLEQVFRNLIDNSIQAMPDGGRITIDLTRRDDQLEFSLSDEGHGFSKAALACFGETFYSEREGGMGLGLSLVSGVIRAHGGTVSAANSAEGSADVRGTLPLNHLEN